MLRPLRLKTGMLRPLLPRTGMLRLCATEEILRDFARPRQDMLRLCTTQNRYVAPIATQNGYVVFRRPNICGTLSDPKQICCDFMRLKKGMLRPLRLKMGMLRLWATEILARLCPTKFFFAFLRSSKTRCCNFALPK